jgi:hypothetical protein
VETSQQTIQEFLTSNRYGYKFWFSFYSVSSQNSTYMKQITEMEKNPFMSSLNNCPEGWNNACPFTTIFFPSLSVDISFKDDVTVVLGASFKSTYFTGVGSGIL